MSKKYYKLPADLLTCGLTPRAILLYCVLADRSELSKKNELFQDKHGSYIIFKIEELCSVLGVGERTAKYALAELEDFGLIERRKQGRTKPQKIYVYATEKVKCKKLHLNEVQKTAPHEVQKTAPHNNNTDNNNTDLSSSSAERMIMLLKMINTAAQDMRVVLTEKQITKLIKRLRKQSDKIGDLQAYLHTAVINAAALPDQDDTGFPAAYDIEDYESTSVLDEDDW